MREILFRGKRKDNGEWVEGGIVSNYFVDGDVCILSARGEIFSVDPATVGQYTVMEDCTDRKIFEGDIMKTAVSGLKRHTGVVEFIDGSFGLKCTDGSAFFLCFVAGCYQVIGNIHDNPELLEEAAPC